MVITDETQLDHSAAKAVSPGSSITRRLEWDSMADVGYANAEHGAFSQQNLSTLEKIALRSRLNYKKATSDTKDNTKPDIDVELQNVAKMGVPKAHSTPEMENEKTSASYPVTKKQPCRTPANRRSVNIRSSKKTVIKRMRNSGTFKLDYKNIQESANVSIDMTKKLSFDLPKDSSNINDNAESNNVYRMTHEKVFHFETPGFNIPTENPDKGFKVPSPLNEMITSIDSKSKPSKMSSSNDSKSNHSKMSSSIDSKSNHSKMTTSTDSKSLEISTSNKEIQTSARQRVSTSAQTFQDIDDGLYLSNILSKTPIILNVLRNTGKLKTYSAKRRKKKTEPSSFLKLTQNLFTSPDKESIDHFDSEDEGDEQSAKMFGMVTETSTKCSDLTGAESFEYVPGHMYENKTSPPKQTQNTNSIPNFSPSLNSASSMQDSRSNSNNTVDFLKMYDGSSPFNKDLNTTVDLISKLVNIKHKNPELKKKLIKKVVKILVTQDYPEDEVSEQIAVSSSDKLTSDSISDEKISHGGNPDNVPSQDLDIHSVQKPEITVAEIHAVPEKDTMSPEKETVFSEKKVYFPDKFTYIPERIAVFPAKITHLPDSRSPIDRCLTLDAPVLNKLVESSSFTRSVKSAPVSLSYSDYLEQKAKSSQPGSGLTLPNENVSESRSSTSKNQHKTKSSEISQSNYTMFSSTPKVSSGSSKVESKKGRTKSEEFYEQYILAKQHEEEQQKQRLQKQDILKMKQRELQLKEDLAVSISKIKKAYTAASSVGSTDTQNQLNIINDEILQLTILKLKLENKHVRKNQELLKSDNDYIQSPGNEMLKSDNIASPCSPLQDEGASGDRGTSNKPTPVLQESQPPILTYYSVTSPDYGRIPPLNLAKSSDESCESTLNNVEDLDSGHSSYPKSGGKRISSTSKYISLSRSTSPGSNAKSTLSRNPQASSRRSIDISKDVDQNRVKFHYVQKTNAVEFASSDNNNDRCDKSCGRKISPPPLKTPTTMNCHKCVDLGILCPCCRSNLISSSSSMSCTKPTVARELKKLENVYEKYQKCKVLQSFMKEYDDLVMKYALSKNANSAENPDTNVEQNTSKGSQRMPTKTATDCLCKVSTSSRRTSTRSGEASESPHRTSTSPHRTSTSPHRSSTRPSETTTSHHESNARSFEASSSPHRPSTSARKQSKRPCEPSSSPHRSTYNVGSNNLVLNAKKGFQRIPAKTSIQCNTCPDQPRTITTEPPVVISLYKHPKETMASDNNITFQPRHAELRHVPTPKCIPAQHEEECFCEDCSKCATTPKETVVTSNRSRSKSPRRTETYMKKPVLVNAYTSPFVTPRQAADAEKPCFEDEIQSPSQPSTDGAITSKSSDSAKTYSKASHISDQLIQKVRLAFAKEYEDIIKKYADLKSASCCHCRNQNPHTDCTPRKREKKKCAKVNRVNVGESEPFTSTSARRVSRSRDRVSKERTSSDVPKCCPKCKNPVLTVGLKLCLECEQKKNACFETMKAVQNKKAVAYNLVIESTDSLLEESIPYRNISLEEIVVKVPKLGRNKCNGKKNVWQALRVVSEEFCEEKGSTDEQIKEFSSLNSDRSGDSSSGRASSSEGSDNCNGVPEHSKKYNLTVEEFLRRGRPDFIRSTEKRQECLKGIHKMRLVLKIIFL